MRNVSEVIEEMSARSSLKSDAQLVQELNRKKRKMMKNFEVLKRQVIQGKKRDFESDSQKRIEEIMNESDWTSRRVYERSGSIGK